MNIGIPIIDSVLEIFPWDNSEEYKKITKIYGIKIQQTINELMLMPLLGFESVNDLAKSLNRDKDEYYNLLKNSKIDWMKLQQEFSLEFFMSLLRQYQNHKDPSYRSRWRMSLILDDTMIKRWNIKMAGSFKTYNYMEKRYIKGQTIVFLAVAIEKKFIFPLLCAFVDSKDYAVKQTRHQKVEKTLKKLYQYILDEGLSFDGLRLCGDSSYTNETIANLAKELKLEFVGTAKGKYDFTLDDGSEIKCSELQHGNIPSEPRQSSKIDIPYYRLFAHHSTLGRVVLCIYPCTKKTEENQKIKYWVYLSTSTNLDCISIYRQQKLRWKIEAMFRNFKQYLGIQCYHGIGIYGQQAWLALSCIRFIFC